MNISTFTKSVLLCCIILNINLSHSQNQTNVEPCGFDKLHKEKLDKDLNYRLKLEEFERYLLKNSSNLKTTSTNYKVPVVVHVMSEGTSLTSITDQEIQDAINDLNQRYRKITGSLGDGDGVDVTLEFSLAVRDPNGNCTNGIVRYDLSGNVNYKTNGVYSNLAGITDNALKAFSFWNSSQYYNIWLVSEIDGNNGGSGVQGYAYMASAHGMSFDGTVMLASKFKIPGNTTTTHELGHAFNLFHTFNGDNNGTSCPTNVNCLTEGDLVCDTPPHIRSGSDCVTENNSCSGNTSSELYIHNYMDYSSDVCQSEFTDGQKTRVVAAMNTLRSSFLESNGNLSLIPVSLPSVDFTASSNFVCTNSTATLVDRSTCIPNTFVNSNSFATISHLWTLQSGATILTSTDQNPTFTFSVAGVYDVTLAVTTSFGTHTETKTKFIYVNSAPSIPCSPISINEGNFWQTVNNVTLNSINSSSSSYINTAYSNLTCSKSTLLTAGQTYQLSLSLRSSTLHQFVEVYIDYNNNSILEETEKVYVGSIASDTTNNGLTEVKTTNLTIPLDAVTETPLLMRVIGEALPTAGSSISAGKKACTNSYTVGDVEDYTVIIQSSCTNSTAAAGIDASICSGSVFTASATATNGTVLWLSSGTGTFANATIENAVYTPSAQDITNGNVTLTMNVTNSGTCSNATDQMVLAITGTPTTNAGMDATICETSSFTASATGTNGAILWSSNGTGVFSNASIENAVYTPSLLDITNGSVILTVNVSSGGCANATDDLNLTISNTSLADAGIDASICETSIFIASATGTNGSILWTSTGTGDFTDASIENAIYTPSIQDISDGNVTLTMTVTNPGVCSNASDDLTLNITGTPIANAGMDATICETSVFTASATGTNGSILWTSTGTGLFTDASIENAVYTPSPLDITNGSVVLTMTVSSVGCADAADDLNLTISNTSLADAGNDEYICLITPLTLNASSSNGIISWVSSGSGVFTNNTIEDVEYTPSAQDIIDGSIILTMFVTNPGVCPNVSDVMDIIITGSPSVNAGIHATICESILFSTDATTNNGSINWVSSGTGTFDNNSIEDPEYTPSNADITNGSVTLTITVSSNGCLDAVDDMILSIDEVSTVNAGVDETICAGVVFTTSGTSSNGTILWSSNGDGFFSTSTVNNSIYLPGVNDLANGSVTLLMTVTNTGVCGNVNDDMILTIGNTPSSDAGIDASICENTLFTTDATATNGSIVWESSGTGTFNNITIENPEYTPSNADITYGSVTLTMTVSSNGCLDAIDDVLLTISSISTVDAGISQSLCSTNPVILNGASTNGANSWGTNGTGTFSNNTLEDPVYTPSLMDIQNGNVTLTLNVTNNGVCSDVNDFVSVTFYDEPNVSAGLDASICSSSVYTTNASSNSSVTWTTSGDGVFMDDDLEITDYTPGQNDILNRTVTLTLSTFHFVCNSINDNMILTIDELPSVSFITNQNQSFCLDAEIDLDATVSNGQINWTTNGDGVFVNSTLEDPSYFPGTSDIASGQVVINLQVTEGLSCPPVSNQLTISIAQKPALPIINLTDTCGYSSLSINGNGNYTWSTGQNGNSITTLQVEDISVFETINGCQSSSNSVIASPKPIPSVTIGAFADLCFSSPSFTMSGGLPLGGYYFVNDNQVSLFKPNVIGNGTHSVVYKFENSFGCSSSDTTSIYIGCADITDIANSNSTQIYPNPTNGTIYISSEFNLSSIQVIDQTGRVVFSSKIGGKEFEYSFDLIEDGIYYIELDSESGKSKHKISLVK